MARAFQSVARQLRLLCALALVCCGLAAAAAPHGDHPRDEHGHAAHPRAPTPEDLARARSKWDALPAERRAELAEAWRKLQQLPAEERAKLVERAERLRSMRKRFEAEIPPEARVRLAGLAPEAREHALRELMHSAWRERGAQLRERLPERWRSELEQLTPEARAERMARFRENLSDRGLRLVLDKTGERLGLAKEELERVQALPAAEKEREARLLLARLTPEQASKLGLRASTQAELDALCALPLQELVATFLSARLERDLRAKGLPEERVQALVRLSRTLEPRQEDWTALHGVAEPDRRAAIEEMRRRRTLDALRASGLVEPLQLAQLEALQGAEAAAELRKALEALGLPSRHGWRGRGRDERGPGERGPDRGPGERPQGGPDRDRGPWEGRGRKDGERPRSDRDDGERLR